MALIIDPDGAFPDSGGLVFNPDCIILIEGDGVSCGVVFYFQALLGFLLSEFIHGFPVNDISLAINGKAVSEEAAGVFIYSDCFLSFFSHSESGTKLCVLFQCSGGISLGNAADISDHHELLVRRKFTKFFKELLLARGKLHRYGGISILNAG